MHISEKEDRGEKAFDHQPDQVISTITGMDIESVTPLLKLSSQNSQKKPLHTCYSSAIMHPNRCHLSNSVKSLRELSLRSSSPYLLLL
jgi:hypothetical protein